MSTSCQINYKPHEGGFSSEFPPLLQSSTVTPDELTKTLERVSDQFLEILETSHNLKRWSRFGLLVFSFVLTSIVGIALWLVIFLSKGLTWFFIIFLGFILVEGAFFIVLLYLLNWWLDKLAKKKFEKLKDSLSAESSSNYEPKGVQIALKYLTESVEIMPSIKIQLLDAFDPKSAWHKFPTIIIGEDVEKITSKIQHEKKGDLKETYAILEDE
eukprot:gene12804-7074_t